MEKSIQKGSCMYFFKVKYRHGRTYKVLRARTTISLIVKFLMTLPFSKWRAIDKIKIERITDVLPETR